MVVAIRGGQRAEGGRLSGVGGGAGREADYTVVVAIRGRQRGERLYGYGRGAENGVGYTVTVAIRGRQRGERWR